MASVLARISHKISGRNELGALHSRARIDPFPPLRGLGIAPHPGTHWSIGLELRNVNVFPEYDSWENSALFPGSVVSYRQEKWCAALTVLPQFHGWNEDETVDGNDHLELEDHERMNVRLLMGFNF